jgi:hypothetical protein
MRDTCPFRLPLTDIRCQRGPHPHGEACGACGEIDGIHWTVTWWGAICAVNECRHTPPGVSDGVIWPTDDSPMRI